MDWGPEITRAKHSSGTVFRRSTSTKGVGLCGSAALVRCVVTSPFLEDALGVVAATRHAYACCARVMAGCRRPSGRAVSCALAIRGSAARVSTTPPSDSAGRRHAVDALPPTPDDTDFGGTATTCRLDSLVQRRLRRYSPGKPARQKDVGATSGTAWGAAPFCIAVSTTSSTRVCLRTCHRATRACRSDGFRVTPIGWSLLSSVKEGLGWHVGRGATATPEWVR